MTSTELELTTPGAIMATQVAFTEQQVALLRQVGIESAEPAELDLFFHICKRSGLDPFARQIYMIPREMDTKVRVDAGNGNTRLEIKRVIKQSIQTGIDGYRLIGMRAAKRDGVAVGHDPALWCGPDGQWMEFWKGQPVAARYTIRVDGTPTQTTVMFDEFAQKSGRGELTHMWKTMPCNQLAVRAEAACWRKAFPSDFAGVELENEQPVVIDSDGTTVQSEPRRGGKGVSALRERAQAAQEQQPVDEDVIPVGMPEETRRKWLNRMFQLLGEADCTDRDDQIIVLSELAGRGAQRLEHRDELGDDELRQVVDKLNKWSKADELRDEISEILNTFDLAAEKQPDEPSET